MVISTLCYAVAAAIPNGGIFYTISYLSRLVQGIADAQICIALFSITSIEFTEEPAKWMGFMQGSLALGMLMGPVLSSAVFPLFKYAGTFIFYGVTIAFFGMGSCWMLPNRLNSSKAAQELDLHSEAAIEA